MRRGFLLFCLLLPGLGAAGPPPSGRGVWWPVLRLSCCWGIKRQYSHSSETAPQEAWAAQLAERATMRQLTRLCDHYSPVVRCYAFEALRQRPEANPWPIVARHLTDNEWVGTYIGCIQSGAKTGDLFCYRAAALLEDSAGGTAMQRQRRMLDSLLVHQPGVRLFVQQVRLARLQPVPGWHSRLHQLASRHRPGAAVALARFQQPADVPALLDGFRRSGTENDAIQAAALFPAPNFYPILVRIFEREWQEQYYDYEKWELLYQALSRYPQHPQTLLLFERTIRTDDNTRLNYLGNYLAQALKAHPHPAYEAIQQQLDKLVVSKERSELYPENENSWP